MKRAFVIAEAGVNHNGDIQTAKKMIEVAAKAGADAVKFQTFKADKIISQYAPKAHYQTQTTDAQESQLDMVRRYELTAEAHNELFNYCQKNGIQFLSTPFDLGSIDLLYKLGLSIFKIPSGEITNLPYLRKVGSLNKEIIMSTGMATMDEIKQALKVLTISGTLLINITILHCNTEYPTPLKDVNLSAMIRINQECGAKVGYSDHTLGITIPIAAVAMGARVIEKHFTLDRTMEGPDHQASLEPHELEAMIAMIREVEVAMGDGDKKPSASEIGNILVVRKSIVAARDIEKDEAFSEENLTIKRPGTGISPMRWDQILGRKAVRNFKEDEVIEA